MRNGMYSMDPMIAWTIDSSMEYTEDMNTKFLKDILASFNATGTWDEPAMK